MQNAKYNLVAWKQVYKPKKEGGLEVRDLKMFNLALLSKWWWGLLSNPKGQLHQVIRDKYGHFGKD